MINLAVIPLVEIVVFFSGWLAVALSAVAFAGAAIKIVTPFIKTQLAAAQLR